MLKNFAIGFILLILVALNGVQAHATLYPKIQRNETCYKPEPAEIFSYHIHFMFWQHNNESVKGAIQVRNQFIQRFKEQLGKKCNNLFHNDFNCMFDVQYEPGGPFIIANWAVFVLPEYLEQMAMWTMQHKGQYSVLVHPNSGCELEDHSWWAIWGGHPYPIDMTAFKRDIPEKDKDKGLFAQ